MSIVSNLFFAGHVGGIIFTNFGWIYTPYVLAVQPVVICSWYLNQNRCLISQLEHWLFGRTFFGDGEKFYVPRRHRYLLYANFIAGCLYYGGGMKDLPFIF